RDLILKFSSSKANNVSGAFVKVEQIQNSFPFGSCITRSSIDNEDLVRFLVKNFNWVVFGNELKWSWTEPQQGNFNYKDADDLLDFCKNNNLEVRGHCIFWEVEYAIQPWVQGLNKSDLTTAVQNRLTDLVTRYKGKFRHYDVDNEMLHGSFYKDRLGKDIQATMFRTSHQLDPSATLFVNDYHIEDGSDVRSSPEEYIRQILDLQRQGAPVGGIGLQGHIDSPVGPIVSSALDKVGTLGLPIWFTELDVSSANEFIRADDLEVMLREAFAHPAVEGIILWGFWELYMSRENAHLVNAEGKINAAGKRYLALKKEWLSRARGYIDVQGSPFAASRVDSIKHPPQEISSLLLLLELLTPRFRCPPLSCCMVVRGNCFCMCDSGTCNWWLLMGNCTSGNPTDNIIVNHDFYKGLYSWHPNCCNGFIVSANSGNQVGLSPKSGGNYAVIKNRTEHWQGLEQDITSKISPGSTYSVSARVGVSGPLSGSTDVMATLKLLNHGSGASYMFIGKTSVSKGKWEMVEGTFSLPTVPNQVIFYLEGPPPGVELLIDSVVIRRPSSSKSE
ncbi:hypothetical protein Golob_010851, partial [Gossypium lobatum]|nr:hypothetical protein [Gossypium lobatum]